MDGVTAISQRVAQIQSRIAQVSAPADLRGASFETVLGAAVLAELPPTRTVSAAPVVSAAQALGGGPAMSTVGSGAGRVDGKGVPTELRTYGNGKIPASALSPVAGTSHTLWEPAARSLEALRDAAAADGVTIGITDSYRTYDTQVDLVRRKGLYSQGGLAAPAGTSMHGWGVAVDLKLDSTAQAWMRTNAGRFGFVENVPREPWHWQYVPTR